MSNAFFITIFIQLNLTKYMIMIYMIFVLLIWIIIKSYIKLVFPKSVDFSREKKEGYWIYFPNFLKMPLKFPIPKPWAIFPKSGKKTCVVPNADMFLCHLQVEHVLPLLKKGIGIHHGGLLPLLKETIEILFSEGLIKVSGTRERHFLLSRNSLWHLSDGALFPLWVVCNVGTGEWWGLGALSMIKP